MGLATGAGLLKLLIQRFRRGFSFVAMGVIVCASIPQAIAVQVYDSGWAVSERAAPQASLLNANRVPVEQLLPKDAIDRVEVPKKKLDQSIKTTPLKPSDTSQQSGKSHWRPRTPSSSSLKKQDSVASPNGAGPVGEAAPDSPPLATKPAPSSAPSTMAPSPAPAAPTTPKSLAEAFELPQLDSLQEPEPQVAPRQDTSTLPSSPLADITPSPTKSAKERDIREPAPFPGFSAEPEMVDAAPLKSTPLQKQDKEATIADGPLLGAQPSVTPKTKPQPEEAPTRIAKRPSPPKQSAPTKKSEPADKPTPAAKPQSKTPVRTAPANEPSTTQSPRNQPERSQSEPPAVKSQPVKPLPPLSRSQQYLRRRIRSVLSYYYRKPLNNRDHDPWEMMHGMLAYGLHSRVLDTTNRNEPVTAIGYLCFNKPCKRKRLMHLTPEGELDAEVAYGLQGHKGQFLAMLAQCNVSRDYPIRVDGKEFTIHDLIAAEQRTCYVDTELTFKLIALMHYLDSDAKWTSEDGESWDIPRLIHEERNQQIRGAACGGTHRLSGLALAARLRVERGEPLEGEWLEAQRFTEQYQNYAFRLQNRDGSLSTEWFRGPGAEEDINRRARTTGHILEWLIYSLPEEQLTNYRTVRAVNYLTSLLSSNTDNLWEVGPLAHALHALKLYEERVFEPYDKADQVAASGRGNNNRRPATPSYQNISSRVYGTYPSHEEVKQALAEAENPGGLRGLLGLGSRGGRRSR